MAVVNKRFDELCQERVSLIDFYLFVQLFFFFVLRLDKHICKYIPVAKRLKNKLQFFLLTKLLINHFSRG